MILEHTREYNIAKDRAKSIKKIKRRKKLKTWLKYHTN